MLGQIFLARDWRKMGLILADSCEREWGKFGYFYELNLIRKHPISSVRDCKRGSQGIVGGACATRYQKCQVICMQGQVQKQRRKLGVAI